MLKNYIKIALRNLFRNKGFSVINISGLAIGMASAILILLWVQNEISYDRFHEKNSRLYEIWENNMHDGALQTGLSTQQLIGPALKNDYPEIENTARVSWEMSILFGYGDKQVKATGIWVDPSFLTMFSFPLLKGDVKTALNDPYSLVITEKMGKKLFGESDPLGKLVKFDNSENFKISGVLKDLPNNSQFNFEFLESSAFLESKKYIDADWTDVSIMTFALLKPNTTLTDVNSKIKNIVV